MTQNSSLKKKIRARMKETGEKYTEARRAVLAENETPMPPTRAEEEDWNRRQTTYKGFRGDDV